MEETAKQYTFEDSLKSIETENFLDRIFYRPIGYRIALLLAKTPVTPNTITIISIFIGVFAGVLLSPQNIWINIAGFALLVIANILDCVDGQLARLTGIKSPIGRILDGLAGNLWFISIYIAIALRLSADFGAAVAWTAATLSGLSNLIQSNIVDYYKTAHLYFISSAKGNEFETVSSIKAKHSAMPRGINKALYVLYVYYSTIQMFITPQLQKLLARLTAEYGKDLPQDIRNSLRANSSRIMPILNIITFNGRSIALLISVLTQIFWIYLAFEIVVLNIVLVIAIRRYEQSCKVFQ